MSPFASARSMLGFAGAALIMVGSGAIMIADAVDVSPRLRQIGHDLPVNRGATDPRDLSAHNTPSAVRNPKNPANVVVANRIDTPRFSCALHVSLDSSSTFQQTPLPLPRLATEPKCYAPTATFAADGQLYVAFVTLHGRGNLPQAVWLTTSRDGGRTLSEPRRILGELAFQVRLVADRQDPGRLYLTWLQAEATTTLGFPDTGYPINVATSHDGGVSWSGPAQVSSPDHVRAVAPTLTVDGDQHLYVAYIDLADDRLDWSGAHEGRAGPPYRGSWRLIVATSTDGGKIWRRTQVAQVLPIQRITVFVPDVPSIVVDDRSERLYVTFHSRTHGDPDVWLWTSDDAGASWSTGATINDTPRGDGTWQYLPAIDVAPDGRLDVIYYDRHHAENLTTHVSMQSSTDGGRTFSSSVTLSDQSFDPRIGFGSARGSADLGAQIDVLSSNDRASAFWTDTRNGTQASGKQDLMRQLVTISSPESPLQRAQVPLRYGGSAAAAGGIALSTAWLLRKRSQRSKVDDATVTS